MQTSVQHTHAFIIKCTANAGTACVSLSVVLISDSEEQIRPVTKETMGIQGRVGQEVFTCEQSLNGAGVTEIVLYIFYRRNMCLLEEHSSKAAEFHSTNSIMKASY